MRVIAGSAGGLRLDAGPVAATRPFLEMARGALFNSLAGRLAETRVLDVYAGSGALGIEALSRGAEQAVFVEADPRAARTLAENLARCGLAARARIMTARAESLPAGLDGDFDLIFVDPPFADARGGMAGEAEQQVVAATARMLAPEGLLVFRYETERDPPPPEWGGLALTRDRRYGRSRVLIYANTSGKPPIP